MFPQSSRGSWESLERQDHLSNVWGTSSEPGVKLSYETWTAFKMERLVSFAVAQSSTMK